MCVVAAVAQAAGQAVRSATVSRAPGYTRLQLETDQPLRHVLHVAGDRVRVLLELADVLPGPALDDLDRQLGRDNPHLTAIQLHWPGPDTVVLELDLRGRVKARALPLPPQDGHRHRLVVDIYPATAATRFGDEDPAVPDAAGEELWLAVQLNRQEPPVTALFLMTPDHRLSARRDDLERWRLVVPPGAGVVHADEEFVPLSALPALSYNLDLTTQTLGLAAPARLFTHTDIGADPSRRAQAMPTALGAFFNYDLFADRTDSGTGPADTHTSGLFELGVYDGFGVVTTSFAHRDLDAGRETVRLDSTWTVDRPERMASLRMGDAVSRAASWGGAVRFGGLQWSTNFATQPGFTAMPLPGLSGEAVLPSTVDLYINDIRRLHQDVAPGPFTLQDAPVISGQGDARLVVRDILGREQVVTQAFYASPRLLRDGLQDYSYEAGNVRESYGQLSNEYGRFFAAGTHRLGFSDRLTGEVHAEALEAQQTGGLGAATLLPGLGVLSAAVAGSHSDDRGEGQLLALGFERQARRFNVGLNGQVASAGFVYLGLQPGALAPRQVSRAYASYARGRGSVALAYSVEDRRDQPTVELLNANLNLRVPGGGSLGLYALHTLSPEADTTLGITFAQPLGDRRTFSAGASGRDGDTQGYVQLQRGLPAGTGIGYRLRAGMHEDSDSELASVSAQNDVGTYLLEAARHDDQEGLRASASGGLVLVRDGLFASRRLNDSFALVHVPGYANVRVYADNQLVARTDADGNALVPRLRAYQRNPIRIEATDLPLDAQVGTVRFEAVPPYRSGLLLEFPVRPAGGATLTLLLDNGQPVPAGALARLEASGETFPVGLKGLLYLRGLGTRNRLTVSWKGQRCQLDIAVPAGGDPLPDLGPHTCAGVTP